MITKVEVDENGDFVIIFPNFLFENEGWLVGDELDVIEKDGGIVMHNISLRERQDVMGETAPVE